MKNAYVGIDVQLSRPCVAVTVDDAGNQIQTDWFDAPREIFQSLAVLAEEYELHIGIDAPRQPLSKARKWYWNGATQQWRKKTAKDKGLGRHCEVVVSAHKLAKPQWTPMKKAAPDWMKLGFELFQTLEKIGETYEAFPSATYEMLKDDPSAQLTINFSKVWKRGAGDLFDAMAAAVTVKEFVENRGCEVGGGDGQGSIILPRPLAHPIDAVLQWPNY